MPCKIRAKSVQNFFGFYRFLRDLLKMKNDCKRSRIKEFTVYDPNRSDVGNGDGGNRTHVQK